MADLLEFVDMRAVEALNAKPDKSVGNALKQGYRDDDLLVLESDTDEQILLHIPFQHAVKVGAVVIKSTAAPQQAPKLVKLFVNRPTIGFSEAADSAGTQDLELTEEQLAGEPIALRLVKFTRVNCLTIFVESNQSDEETTIIQKIRLLGSGGDTMNVGEIKDISKEHDHS